MKLVDIAREFSAANKQEERSRLLELGKKKVKSLKPTGNRLRDLQAIGIAYIGNVNSSAKLIKGRKKGFDSYVLYLAAGNTAGIEVCPFRSKGCSLACLMTSGRALIEYNSNRNRILGSRIAKTWLAIYNRPLFNFLVSKEIESSKRKARSKKSKFCVRLNGTSDLIFSSIVERFPRIQFYDYTKNIGHALSNSRTNLHLTFSYSEANLAHCKLAYAKGLNIALPVIRQDLGKVLEHPNAYSMDETDLRFLDPVNKRFGVLSVKQTPNTQAGINKRFFLNASQFETITRQIVNA